MTAAGSLTSVFAEVSAWGPFFAVDTSTSPAQPWRPMRELLDDPAVLSGRVADVRSFLAAGRAADQVAVRVAASVTQLGLVARLLSPALGCAVHSGLFPVMDLAGLWWQPRLGSTFPLALPDPGTGTAQDLISGPIRDLVRAMRVYSVSERVLWGNVASAINGAATMIGTARAAEVASQLLDLPPLRTTSTRLADGRFRRRGCCLIYQASPDNRRAAVCGDCVLAGPA